MARNFIILFEEKEGSTPLVRLLDNFAELQLLHLGDPQGWEPFDAHNCGPMPRRDYMRCLDLIYGEGPTDWWDQLDHLYRQRARKPLVRFEKNGGVGFKMRFRPQRTSQRSGLLRRWQQRLFQRSSLDAFARHDLTVFVTVRQDLLRWALSLYHGDGTGRPGHLQFALAAQRIEADQIPAIHVDLDRFARQLADCEARIERKRQLLAALERRGIRAQPLLYERFCDDRPAYFAELCRALEMEVDAGGIQAALDQGTSLRKVHDADIRSYVENAEQVLDRFGEPFARW